MTTRIELFPRSHVVGIFRGFREGGMEFHADLSLPYRTDFHRTPMHGQFVLVQLESPDEAVLGRICSLASEGRLSGPSGEDFSLRAMKEEREVPDHLREDHLKYRVNIRVLGVVRVDPAQGITFVASHRRLPHVGSPVAFLNDELMKHVAGHYAEGADLGFLAMGEYVFAKDDARYAPDPGMQVHEPCVVVKFPVSSLVSRRTFVFARAGFGKSNLNKLLFSKLYETTPTVQKRGERRVPVGTILFDPDGEYFWPDDKGRPGFCDVPGLKDQLVVFTSRKPPSPFYGSFVAGGIKLDIRRFRPGDVISIALPPEKQDQQNVRKLRSMNEGDWARLVDLVHRDGNAADMDEVRRLLRLEDGQDMEALAARGNLTSIVQMLHDPSSRLVDVLLLALGQGKLCIVDVSQLRGKAALILSGLILRRIFQWNQDQFTEAQPKTIPTIAVVEEAQSVLNDASASAAPYIEWVKEGRKYDLGAVLITQQPGSIPTDILSQGDNWFIFHLLSSADLQNVRRANAHFSEDILSALLNEPIQGQGVFWSSVASRPYPVPIRVLSFNDLFKPLDPEYRRPAQDTFAVRLKRDMDAETATIAAAARSETEAPGGEAAVNAEPDTEAGGVDVMAGVRVLAAKAVRESPKFQAEIDGGIPWAAVITIIESALPPTMKHEAKRLVPVALDDVLGPKNVAWNATRRGPRSTLFVVRGPTQPSRA